MEVTVLSEVTSQANFTAVAVYDHVFVDKKLSIFITISIIINEKVIKHPNRAINPKIIGKSSLEEIWPVKRNKNENKLKLTTS